MNDKMMVIKGILSLNIQCIVVTLRFVIWQESVFSSACVFNEASHAEADGGAILDSAGSAAQSLSCKSCEKFSLLNNNGLSKLSLLWFYEYIFISRNGC